MRYQFMLFLGVLILAVGCGSSRDTTTYVVPAAEKSYPAERGDRAERRARLEANLDETVRRLGLNATQEKQFRDINRRFAERLGDARAQGGGDRRAMMQAARRLNEERDQEINAILSEKQRAIYADIKAERRARMESRRGGRRRG